MKTKLLLAACCGPCSTTAIERLFPEYEITVLFWGNNLDTADEYERRLHALQTVNTALNGGRPMIIAPYEHIDLGNPTEPEGGARCEKCFTLRLSAAAKTAVQNGFELFATTLTTSPHKNADVINAIGERIANKHKIKYLPTDFKQNGGFTRSVELSKRLHIYRQKYCGCRKM